MRRRSLLVALAASLSGCAGVFEERDDRPRGRYQVPNETVTRTVVPEGGGTPRKVIEDRTVGESFETATPTPVAVEIPQGPRELAVGEAFRTDAGTVVSVHNARVRNAVECRPGSCETYLARSDEHFLATTVSVNGFQVGPAMPSGDPIVIALEDGRFRLVVDDRRYEYDPDAPLVAFPLPITSTSSAYVEWVPAGEAPVRWHLDGQTLANLSRRSEFSFTSFEFPSRLPSRSAFTRALVSLAVVNTGGRDGEFVGRFVVDTGDQSSDYVVSQIAPRGVETTILREFPVPTATPGSVTFRAEWADGEVEATVPIGPPEE